MIQPIVSAMQAMYQLEWDLHKGHVGRDDAKTLFEAICVSVDPCPVALDYGARLAQLRQLNAEPEREFDRDWCREAASSMSAWIDSLKPPKNLPYEHLI